MDSRGKGGTCTYDGGGSLNCGSGCRGLRGVVRYGRKWDNLKKKQHWMSEKEAFLRNAQDR